MFPCFTISLRSVAQKRSYLRVASSDHYIHSKQKNNSILASKRQGYARRNIPNGKKNGGQRKEREWGERDGDIRRLYVSPSTMGKIFSLMNQDEYTPVPITLQPRSPYFALLDFCHFKANEMSERQGRNRRKRRNREDGPLWEVSSVGTRDRC